MRRLDALGIPWDVTPGVPAFAAAAAALRRELTLPERRPDGDPHALRPARDRRCPPASELDALAAHGTTLVIHLGAQAIEEIAATLIPHYGEDCPAAVVARASWPDEVVLRGTLATIAGAVREAGVRAHRDDLRRARARRRRASRDSHLYSKARARA